MQMGWHILRMLDWTYRNILRCVDLSSDQCEKLSTCSIAIVFTYFVRQFGVQLWTWNI